MSALGVAWAHALVASLWQAPLVAALSWLLEQAGARRASTRYAIRAAALLAMPVLVVGTWLGSLSGSGLAPLAGPVSPAPAWATWGVMAWLAGVSTMSVRMIGQWWRVAALRASAHPVPEPWRERFEQLATSLGMRAPALGISSRCDGPLVLGVLRPLVLLPVGLLEGVPVAVVEAALAHELMHVRRLDPWLHALQGAVEILLFFNPAVWWMSWRMSTEREHACDEAVLRARSQPPVPYARALLALEAWRQHPVPASTLGASGPGLRDRVQRLVSPPRPGPARRWGARLAMLAVAVLLVVALLPSRPPPSPSASIDRLGVVWLPDDVRRYEVEIEQAAVRHGVEPGLLAIMVWVESRGRSDARSPAGARGLLQLMPRTAAEIAELRGLPDHGAARLDEPGYNLDLGAWYLARQIERYEDLSWAVAAYNAGPGRVAAVQRGEAELPEETRRYQATVTALWAQRWLPWSPTLVSRG